VHKGKAGYISCGALKGCGFCDSQSSVDGIPSRSVYDAVSNGKYLLTFVKSPLSAAAMT